MNVEDFIKLELIRDIEPNLYEQIYRSPEYFWSRELAFEASFKGPDPMDKDEANKERKAFYEQIKATIEPDKYYVLQLVEDLFPRFAVRPQSFTGEPITAADAERTRRIFHPRCFRQYFLLKVPSELFSQKDFQTFLKSIKGQDEDRVVELFDQTFRSVVKEDFKRWHFMHLVENEFSNFASHVQRGLCRGMAQNAQLWQADAFELLIAISSTRETLEKISKSDERRNFLRSIVRESASDLYTLMLIRRIEHDLNSPLKEGERYRALGLDSNGANTKAKLLSDIQEIKPFVTEQLRVRYLKPGAPSVFEQFSGLGSGVNRIEPNLFLFNWQYLGPQAQADEKKYLQDLFTRRPQDLNQFLKLMFRVHFIDDYTELKPLIDYKELSALITVNEGVLDPNKVAQFRERYSRSEERLFPELPQEDRD